MISWLRGRIYNRPRAPRRWCWLLVAASCYMVGSWFAGSLIRY